MLLPLLAAIAALQSSPGDTMPTVPASLNASAYLDSNAREMVRRVRERRTSVEHSITSYRALARERISVGLRAMQRDRVLFRKETAARVHWSRDGIGRIELLGARQVVPIAVPRPSLPDDLREDAPDLAFDPRKDFVLRSFGDDDDDDFFRHPLAPGSEVDYRFQSGDTTTLRLSPQRTLRVLELRVIPRRVDARLLQGSFWFDADTHAPVRASFRLTRPVDLERDLREDDGDIPGLIKPIRGELRYLTIDYGLWEQRWWLPRLVALEVIAQAGTLLNIPVSYERSYGDYVVTGDETGDFAAGAVAHAASQLPQDTTGTVKHCHRDSCSRFEVRVPEDSLTLLDSEWLPSSIYAQGESLITEGELRELGEVLGVSPTEGRAWRRPEVQWRYLSPDLLRFNRVEGLAFGGRADVDAGALAADARLWVATADPQVNGEIGVSRDGFSARYRIAAYRRLAAVDPDPRALGPGSSLSALLLGRDDSDYFRTLGAELTGESVKPRGSEYQWRLFAERHSAAEKSTDLSLPHLFDSDREFAPNIVADAADQLGVAATYRIARGLNPLGFRWQTEATLGAETGSYRLVRPSVSAYASFPLPRVLVGAVELAGGTAFGDVPLQRQWFLGGASTVRGFGGGSRIHGDSYWRGRAEIASAFPGARVVLFSDAGWAGARRALDATPALISAGFGASFLDGLIRADLARALRGGSGWRLDLHVDAPI